MKKAFLIFCTSLVVFCIDGMQCDEKERCKKITVQERFKPTIVFQPKKLAVLLGEKIYKEHYENNNMPSFDRLRALPDAAALHIANNSNYQRDTLLHIMARNGNESEVEYLLKIGVDPKAENIYRETPLFLTGKYWHLGLFKALFSAGGYRFKDFGTKNDPINFLVSMPDKEAFLFFKSEIAQKAMKYPSFQEDQWEEDTELKFPYMWIRKTLKLRGHFNFLKYLFNNRDEEMHQGFLLHKAAKQGLECHLAFLIKKRFYDINKENYMGRSPISSAVRGDAINCVTLLVSQGALLQSNEMSPPLTIAVRSGHLNIVEYLLAHGADVNFEDELAHVPLYYAVKKNDVKMVNVLLGSPLVDLTHPSIQYYDSTNPEIIKLMREEKAKRLL